MPGKLILDYVHKSYPHAGRPLKVLNGLAVTVEEGEFVSLVGPSGCGKSTAFHIIGGLTLPTEGRVLIDGRDVTGERGRISYMPQAGVLLPWRTIEDNVKLSLEIAGLRRKEALVQAREWLPKVGLGGYERSYPHECSGGMQQRASFLRALLSPREVMCLDEPFGALDALTRMDMQRWLLDLWEQHRRSVLFVTHSIEEAILLSDRIYVLSDKPTRVLREFLVPFPRPRDESCRAAPGFAEMEQEIYGIMKKEMNVLR